MFLFLFLGDSDVDHRMKATGRSKTNCPVNGECLTKGVIYKAKVMHNNKENIFIGFNWKTIQK